VTVLAPVFIERNAETGYPGVGFEASRFFAGAEMQLGGDAAAAQKKVERRGLLKAIGAEKKITRGSGVQARKKQGLGKQGGIWRHGWGWRGEQTLKEIFPSAKACETESNPRSSEKTGGAENGRPIGPAELRKSPPCGSGDHSRPVAHARRWV